MAFPVGWRYVCPITVRSSEVTGGPHTFFELLLTECSLPDALFDQNGDPARADGGDIRFTSDIDGLNMLPCHVVNFSTGTYENWGTQIWVKVPSIDDGADTVIYLWWGRSHAHQPAPSVSYGQYPVWSSFRAVHLMEDNQDATANDRDLTVANLDLVACKIDAGYAHDGDVTEVSSLAWKDEANPPASRFVSAFWVYVDSTSPDTTFLFHGLPFTIDILWTGPNFSIRFTGYRSVQRGEWRTDATFAPDTWHHVAIVYDGSSTANDPVILVDGAVEAATELLAPNGNLNSPAITAYWGAHLTRLIGRLDTTMITATLLSSNRVATYYTNQDNPCAFSYAGTVETVRRSSLIAGWSLRPLTDSQIIPQRNYLVKQGYQLYARNKATRAVTYLGFIAYDAAPLQLAGINLPNASYEIIIYLQGRLWQDCRMMQTLDVVIAGGVPTAIAPAELEDVDYVQLYQSIRASWVWRRRFGTYDPETFGVWISAVGAPATGGAPDYEITADIPRLYSQIVPQGGGNLWIAVASITDGVRGPVSNLGPIAPATADPAPTEQQADDENRFL